MPNMLHYLVCEIYQYSNYSELLILTNLSTMGYDGSLANNVNFVNFQHQIQCIEPSLY
jgi:hypothetical protein